MTSTADQRITSPMNRRDFITKVAIVGGAAAAAPLLAHVPITAAAESVLPGVVTCGAYELLPTEFEDRTATPAELEEIGEAMDRDAWIQQLLDELRREMGEKLKPFIGDHVDEEFSRRMEDDLQEFIWSFREGVEYPGGQVLDIRNTGPDRFDAVVNLPVHLDEIDVRLEL